MVKEVTTVATASTLEVPSLPRSTLGVMASNIWAHREIVRNLIARNLKVRYHQSVLGYLWAQIEPLLYLTVYYLIFVILAGRPEPAYPLLILLGVLTWRLFAGLVQDLCECLVKNEGLIKRVYFPREVFVAASGGYHLANYALSLVVAAPFMAYYRIRPNWTIAALPVLVLLIVVLATGIGFIACCLHARVRDTRHAIALMTRLGFWLSPVFYTLDRVPKDWQSIYLFNPMGVYLHLVRASVTGRPSGVATEHVVSAVGLSLAIFLIGASLFRRWEAAAVKYL